MAIRQWFTWVVLCAAIFVVSDAWGQATGNVTMRLFNGPPSGACSNRELAKDVLTGDIYNCVDGVWLNLVTGLAPAPSLPTLPPGQTLPQATLNLEYSAIISVSGGTLPYDVTITSGALPHGVTVAPSTDLGIRLTGSPTESGTFPFTVDACDQNQHCVHASLTLVVSGSTTPGTPPVVSPGQTLTATANQLFSGSILVTGGSAPFTSSITSGTLPAGLTLAGTTIAGTPTTVGTSTFTVNVCDSLSQCGSGSMSVTVQTGTLQITSTTCPSGTVGSTYNCTLAATGGTSPYTWTILSRLLPNGLTLSSAGVISGNPSTAGATSSTIHVVDSASRTADATIIISITDSNACGFPHYNCARQDAVRQDSNYAMDTVVPPTAGAPTVGGSHACTAGNVAVASNPLLTDNTTHASNLQACGNIYGKNTEIHETNYNNATIIRLTDWSDVSKTGPCATSAAPGNGTVAVGPGGASEYNVFEMHSNYISINCGTAASIMWFNPTTMRVVTTNQPQGWVTAAGGGVLKLGGAIRFDYSHANTFWNASAGQLYQYTITNGVASTNTTIADLRIGVPCWSAATGLPACPDWAANHTYQPGANILPSHNVPALASCPTQPGTGAAQTGPGVSACAGPHSWQLLNATACTSGGSWPNFAMGATMVVDAGGGRQAGVSQWALEDGSCWWGDMWTPIRNGGAVNWQAGGVGDVTDTIYSAAMGNHTGQDGAGSCFGVWYNSNTHVYEHLNTCSGNVYHTVCNGGTGYNCANGSWGQSYVGNIYTANHPPGHNGYTGGHVIHAFFGSKNNQWIYITHGNCPFRIGSATNHGKLVHCKFDNTTIVNGTSAWTAGPGIVIFWFPPGLKAFDIYSTTNPHTGSPGHMAPGFWQFIYRPQNMSQGFNFQTNDFKDIPAGPWTGVLPVTRTWHDVSKQPFFANNASACKPNVCWYPSGFNNIASYKRQTAWDEHSSWVSNDGTDQTPPCTLTYDLPGQGPASGSGAPLAGGGWPHYSAWMGEVFCYSTAQSGADVNKVWRQGYAFNTYGAGNVNGWFNASAGIGSLSSDGNWYAFNSDWYCTMGNGFTGTAAANCAPQFLKSHAYKVGEMMGGMYGACCQGKIYTVSVAGTSAGAPPTAATNGAWCATAGCTWKSNTVTFKYVGSYNAQLAVFLLKLQ
jgi:hypothetical protein